MQSKQLIPVEPALKKPNYTIIILSKILNEQAGGLLF